MNPENIQLDPYRIAMRYAAAILLSHASDVSSELFWLSGGTAACYLPIGRILQSNKVRGDKISGGMFKGTDGEVMWSEVE